MASGDCWCYNNNNNTLIYIAPACRMTSEALGMKSCCRAYPKPTPIFSAPAAPLFLRLGRKSCPLVPKPKSWLDPPLFNKLQFQFFSDKFGYTGTIRGWSHEDTEIAQRLWTWLSLYSRFSHYLVVSVSRRGRVTRASLWETVNGDRKF